MKAPVSGIFFLLFYCTLNAQTPLTLLKDLNSSPGKGAAYPREIVAMNGNVYFAGDCLWKSDGTPAGTKRVREIINNDGPKEPSSLTAGETLLFFTAWSSDGSQLWVSDGSYEGTRAVKSGIENGYTQIDTIVTIENIAFLYVRFDKRIEVWRSDGTESGTKLVKQIYAGDYFSHITWFRTKLIVLNDEVYFNVYDDEGNGSLWKTDGTDAGTMVVKEGVKAEEGVAFKNAIYFRESGSRLWRTDGTAEGTDEFAFTPGIGPFNAHKFTVVENTLFFAANEGLWKTDGTTAGTAKVKAGLFDFGEHCAVGSTLFFTADDGINGIEPWRSDGTTAGTVMAYETYFGSSYFPWKNFATINGKLFFRESNDLYTLDGSIPVLIEGDGIFRPTALIAFDNVLYFAASSTSHSPELWRSNGTESGTFILTYTDPTTGSSLPFDFSHPTDKLYFGAHTGSNWALFNTDGTAEGTNLIKDNGSSSCASLGNSGTVLFGNNDELWKTDGTEAGSQLIKDIRPGVDAGSITDFTTVGNTVYFNVNDGAIGKELWKSDGTTAGTMLVKDIRPGAASSNIGNPQNFKGQFYFTADDGVHGTELWKTDGSAAGTSMVVDIAPGSTSGNPRFFLATDDFLYFSAHQPSIGSYQLWKSDGTEAGTNVVKTIAGGFVTWLIASTDNVVYYLATSPEVGGELWRSDGTEAGTYLVKDINPGPESSNLLTARTLDGILYFVANDGTHGNELWKSDGTEQGTLIVQDIYAGKHSSEIQSMDVIGDKLYFIARDNIHGHEVWKTDFNDCGAQRLTENLDIQPLRLTHIGERLLVTAKGDTYGEELYYYDPSNNPPEKLTQTIVFPEPSTVRYRDVIELTASSESAAPVTFSTSDVAVASLDGNILTIKDLGSVAITAHHVGDELYCPAISVTHTLNVSKATQSIQFESVAVGVEDDQISLIATATSGLPVTFTTSSDKILLTDNDVELLNAGSANIVAHQVGDDYFMPASPVEQDFCINPHKPIVAEENVLEYKLISSNDVGNQWYMNGVEMDNQTAKELIVISSGVYKVRTSIEGCNSETSDPAEVVILAVEERAEDIRAFPNPFRDAITIETPATSIEIQMLNVLGQPLAYPLLAGSAITLDTKTLPKGMYFLKVRNKSGVRIKKMVKE